MTTITTLLAQLKEQLEEAAFLVSRGNSDKEAHTAIVKSLVLVSRLESELGEASSDAGRSILRAQEAESSRRFSRAYSHGDTIDQEVKKLYRRVPRWFRNPGQINSIILNGYLDLSEQVSSVTVQMLRNKCRDVSDFDGNFNQMKNFGEKNHGKVFDESAGVVTLWEPIRDFVLDLKRKQADDTHL